jgi:23S rRNA (uracil1939-C5)-methyltransferase
VGLYEEGTHRVVDIEHCLQLSPAMSRAARGLQAALASRPEVAGRVREIELAESQDGKALVAALETDLTVEAASGLGWLAHETPWLTGLGVVAGRERRFLPLRGDPHVEASVLGVALRAHVRSFFQANRFLLEDLARAVVEATPPGGAVLDLYAGVGLFSLPLAARAERVRAVEWSAVAVDDFQANAARAGLRNVSIEPADVGAALARLPAGQVESVVLDPPRAGAGPAVVRAVLARRPRSVVYVSCDPPTLGRDLKAFADGSYRVTSVRAFDLFPDTFHVETLVTIAPAERSSPPGALSL